MAPGPAGMVPPRAQPQATGQGAVAAGMRTPWRMEKEPQGQAAWGRHTLSEGTQQVIQWFHAKGDIEAPIFRNKIPSAKHAF